MPQETKQPSFGKEAEVFLKRLRDNKMAEVKIKNKDRYKRIVGVVYCGGIKLVKNGLAWAYLRYSKDFGVIQYDAKRLR